ncbi:MAG: hypothetical protein EA349_01200 [Halomonadaceae bacterium]|nr:MAG: hypothetical protein EA349_01200 [Halomonadaceae bacterium]
MGSDTLGAALPEAVGSELLGQQRARAVPTLQLSENSSHIDLQENMVLGTTHGTNTVTEGAFSGARGISSVIQNTGHNVAIQESTNVNIVMHP